MSWKTMTLSGWGRSSAATMRVCRSERVAQARLALADVGQEGLIAHGGGRSYGDAALNSGGRGLLTTRLDRLLSFDQESGEVVAEAGVTFADLMDIFLPRGYVAPVTPGTAFATLGGAVANDVHGKNHDRAGSFGDHLLWLELLLPSGGIIRTSRTERPELFAATIGGVGLTGIILALAFRLTRIPSPELVVQQRRVADLDGFLAELECHRRTATYSVGWIDGLARGRCLGRGIIEVAEPAPAAEEPEPRRRTWRIPFDFPSFVLSRAGVAAFNAAYYRRVPEAGRTRQVPYARFLYPLDALLCWNRIYGKRGFYQFQCVVPDETSAVALRDLLEQASAARSPSFLAVLKTLGSEGQGYLSFPRRGYTLALDFPRRPGLDVLMARLERTVLEHGGRIYLAKDACLSSDAFAAMYPKVKQFRSVLAEIDPSGRMQSDLARRVGIVNGGR